MIHLSAIRQLATSLHRVVIVFPLPVFPSSQETYLVKHMEKHNPEQLTAPAVMAGQAAQQKRNQSQGPAGAQTQVESANSGGSSQSAGAGNGAMGRNQQGQTQSQRNYPQAETISCPFDLHQYKTVSASDIHYKPVAVENITSSKDLYLTVSTSTIQVEHLNSWRWSEEEFIS